MRILVVDDDVTLRLTVRSALESRGYQVEEAEDGELAVRMAEATDYDAVILDPPSYGHGPNGEVWQLNEHLSELLSVCNELTQSQPQFVLLTCHAPDYPPERLAQCLLGAGFRTAHSIDSGDLWLTSADNRKLHAGAFARFST